MGDDLNEHDSWLQDLGVTGFTSTSNSVDVVTGADPAAAPQQPWSFDPVDPSKKQAPDINLPPNVKYGQPDSGTQPQMPDWFWNTLPKTRDNTPEWKKWQKAVEDWCKEHHVDPGPLIDMAKDKLNQKTPDDPQDDLVQPDHKDKGDPQKYDPDSDTQTGPTKYTTPPASNDSGDSATSGPGDYNVPAGDTAVA